MTDLTPTQATALKALFVAHRSAQGEARALEAVAFLSIIVPSGSPTYDHGIYPAYDALVRFGYAMQSAGRYWITVLGRHAVQEQN